MLILQRDRHVTASHEIWRRIDKRLGAWESGQHWILTEEILRTCVQYLTGARREESEKHIANTYHSLVLRGNLHTAVR